MTLLEALPKDGRGQIVLDPAGTVGDPPQPVPGTCDPTGLQTNFPGLAGAAVPLSAADYAALQAIDVVCWAPNAQKWRAAGII